MLRAGKERQFHDQRFNVDHWKEFAERIADHRARRHDIVNAPDELVVPVLLNLSHSRSTLARAG